MISGISNLELIEFWDFEKNKRKPTELSHGSHEKVWWKCKKGHTYQQALNKKVSRKSGCPVCSGRQIVAGIKDFATAFPEIAKEWHPTKNKDLKPSDISKKSGRKVWWLCANGHEWEASPNNRSRGIGCPCCSGRVPKKGVNDLKTIYPEIAKEWLVEKNGDLMPEQFLPKSGKKVWWRCSICGYEWETVIRTRPNGHGCPRCNHKKK